MQPDPKRHELDFNVVLHDERLLGRVRERSCWHIMKLVLQCLRHGAPVNGSRWQLLTKHDLVREAHHKFYRRRVEFPERFCDGVIMLRRCLVVREESQYERVRLGQDLHAHDGLASVVRLSPHLPHVGFRVTPRFLPDLLEAFLTPSEHRFAICFLLLVALFLTVDQA